MWIQVSVMNRKFVQFLKINKLYISRLAEIKIGLIQMFASLVKNWNDVPDITLIFSTVYHRFSPLFYIECSHTAFQSIISSFSRYRYSLLLMEYPPSHMIFLSRFSFVTHFLRDLPSYWTGLHSDWQNIYFDKITRLLPPILTSVLFAHCRMAIRYIRHLQAILEFGPEYETKLFTVPCTQYLPPPTYYGYQPPYGQCWTTGDYAPNINNQY